MIVIWSDWKESHILAEEGEDKVELFILVSDMATLEKVMSDTLWYDSNTCVWSAKTRYSRSISNLLRIGKMFKEVVAYYSLYEIEVTPFDQQREKVFGRLLKSLGFIPEYDEGCDFYNWKKNRKEVG